MKCKNCKTKIKNNQKFCPECGAEVHHKKTLSKKTQAFIACACCLALIISGTIGGVYFYNNANSMNSSDSNYIALESSFTDVKVTDEESALEAISSVADVIGINNVDNELKISSTNTIDNDTYYRFQQYYNDIPVYGHSLVISADKNGNATALTSNYTNPSNKDIIDISNSEKPDDVEDKVENYLKENVIQLSTFKETYFQQDSKLILSYEVIATTNENIYRIIIDAEDIEILSSENILTSSSSEVQSEDGEVKAIGWKNDDGSYHLYNDENKISVFDFSEIEEKPTLADFRGYGIDTIYSKNNLFDKKGVSLLRYLSSISEYFIELGDPGFYQIHSAINVNIDSNASGGGLYIENEGSLDRFGILSVGKNRNINDVDIIAHEYTHMVTKSLVGWQDSKQASAINEGISDIFGEILENNLNGQADWKHDGRIILDPENSNNKQQYPASVEYLENSKKYKKERFYINKSQTEDYSHYASTIISHSAYLMNIGINENNDKKIGMDLLGKLWYKSIYLMQSSCSFSQCRNAVELSARIMLKNGELTKEQYNCVCEAFDAVGISNSVYSYKYRVKNDFNLRVLNSQNTDNVNFNLKIYKLPENNIDISIFFEKNIEYKLVLEENSLYGNKEIHLEDGVYYLEITDLDENAQNSVPIKTKILVDGEDENAADEVVIHTDFSDITTVVLNKNEKDENLKLIIGEYVFSSGVGAWSTEVNINDDFTFSGMYHDSELGLTGEKNPNGTVIICEFTGKFSTPVKIDDYTYKLTVESISLKNEDGYVYYDNGIEYECVGEPYGFDGCREFYLYIEGRQANDFSEDFLAWIYEYDENSGVLPYNCIRNPQTDVCFVKYESTETNNTEDTQGESTTVKESNENNVSRFYGNETVEQLRKSIIGSWDDLGSIIPEYNFQENGVFNGNGKYSISDDKTLTISRQGYSEDDIYVWSSESWNEFYSHNKSGTYFWYMTDDGILKLNGKEKYRDGVDNFTYNNNGGLMKSISGTWINDTGSKEYRIYDNGTWEESTVYISYGKVINRKVIDNGKVEIVDNTTANLYQEVEHLNQIPGSLELIYDSANDKISVGGTNDTFTRAKYK